MECPAMDECLAQFDITSSNLHLVCPYKNRLDGSHIAASSLRIKTRTTKPELCHFFVTKLSKEIGEMFISQLRRKMNHANDYIKKKGFSYQVLFTLGRLMECRSHLDRMVKNEAELRYAIANPLLGLLIKIFDFKVKLELTVNSKGLTRTLEYDEDYEIVDDPDPDPDLESSEELHSEEESAVQDLQPASDLTPASKAVQSIQGSRCDYSAFHVVTVGGVEISVVVIEAKCDKASANVVAQAMGYYIGLPTTTINPIVMILTENYIQVLAFPFQNNEEGLVNAVLLPKLEYSDGIPCKNVLFLVTLLSYFTLELDLRFKMNNVLKTRSILAKREVTVIVGNPEVKRLEVIIADERAARAALELEISRLKQQAEKK